MTLIVNTVRYSRYRRFFFALDVFSDIRPGLHTLHVARKGRKGRHFVVFRVAPSRSEQVIDVLRLLHDSMDLPRHLPAANESDSTSDPQH